jgi:hypothetical protein
VPDRAYVHVRLGAFELLFCHGGFLYNRPMTD